MPDRVTLTGPALQHVVARIREAGYSEEFIGAELRHSWERDADSGLDPSSVHPPFDANVDSDSRLHWAAAPAMTAASGDLPDIRSALLLTDGRIHVTERWTRTPRTALQMDAVGAAPGFFCDEAVIGTNSIGRAATTGGVSLVRGFEHYADAFAHVTCASRAVTDPITGHLLGVVNMTIADPAPWQLMTALVGRIAHEARQRLLQETGSKSIALYEVFLRAQRRARGPVAAVDAKALYINAAAGRFLASRDHDDLWAWVQRCASPGRARPQPLWVTGGALDADCEVILDGPDLVGAVVRFAPPHSADVADGPLQDWGGLTDSERSVALLVGAGLTNREAASELFLSPHTVDYHLRQIFRKLDIDSRTKLARIVARHSG